MIVTAADCPHCAKLSSEQKGRLRVGPTFPSLEPEE